MLRKRKKIEIQTRQRLQPQITTMPQWTQRKRRRSRKCQNIQRNTSREGKALLLFDMTTTSTNESKSTNRAMQLSSRQNCVRNVLTAVVKGSWNKNNGRVCVQDNWCKKYIYIQKWKVWKLQNLNGKNEKNCLVNKHKLWKIPWVFICSKVNSLLNSNESSYLIPIRIFSH